ncbi:hypothetical protein [Clostridium sp. HMP27]|uniref:hypothetical protein n=1 Tax=Clostridium sp. HMP27 TaxID=1487921 RepID=UPI00052CE4F5|nr:hypothetical protein [Clostridium sp. HMP27]KGK88039.1 hypothetical protein DP68_08915 [Clostridium sp. HMP27]
MDENIEEVVTELYPLSELRANCKELFGVEKEVFDGVFFNSKKDISKEEAINRIKEWLGKEAQ